MTVDLLLPPGQVSALPAVWMRNRRRTLETWWTGGVSGWCGWWCGEGDPVLQSRADLDLRLLNATEFLLGGGEASGPGQVGEKLRQIGLNGRDLAAEPAIGGRPAGD